MVGAVIESNVMERLGVVAEKQVACTFQAKTANVTLRFNLCFRNPRAGFLINDGFYGGHLFEQNLLLNNVMETGDHGKCTVVTSALSQQSRLTYLHSCC